MFKVGDRARFEFNDSIRDLWANGTVVGIQNYADEYEPMRVWFKPDKGFYIPSYWQLSKEYPDAFGTNVKYLTLYEKPVPPIDVGVLL